jgi:hypothetical protein
MELLRMPKALTVLQTRIAMVVTCKVQDSRGVKKTLRYRSKLAILTQMGSGPFKNVIWVGLAL